MVRLGLICSRNQSRLALDSPLLGFDVRSRSPSELKIGTPVISALGTIIPILFSHALLFLIYELLWDRHTDQTNSWTRIMMRSVGRLRNDVALMQVSAAWNV